MPNSLVVAPNGATAYVGSSGGLMVVNLSTYQPTLQTYPIVGGLSTDVITGTVLGVSPDSRYVVVSDVANSLVFLIDTTGTKVARASTFPTSPPSTFAPDDSNIWIGGANGVYVYQRRYLRADQRHQLHDAGLSTNVNSLAWTPDGQSYFASGEPVGQLLHLQRSGDSAIAHGRPMSTVPTACRPPACPRPPCRAMCPTCWVSTAPSVVRLFRLPAARQVPTQTVQTPSALTPAGRIGQCLPSTVTVNTPVTA